MNHRCHRCHRPRWWLMIDDCWRNVLHEWLSFVSRVVVDVIFRQFFIRSTSAVYIRSIVSSQTDMHTYEWPVFIYEYKLYAVYDMYEYVHDSKLGWWQKAQKKHLTMRIRWSDVQGIGFSLSMHLNLWWFPRFSVPRFPVRTDPLNAWIFALSYCHTGILSYSNVLRVQDKQSRHSTCTCTAYKTTPTLQVSTVDSGQYYIVQLYTVQVELYPQDAGLIDRS